MTWAQGAQMLSDLDRIHIMLAVIAGLLALIAILLAYRLK
jgi:uncharacterized membrane protein YozB (DUF420 family)